RPWRRGGVMAAAGMGLLALGLVLYRQTSGATDGNIHVPVERQLTFKGNVGLSSISPDGQSIAFVTGNAFDAPDEDTLRLFVSDLEGGRPLEIAQFGFARTLHWTSDGSSLLVEG